MPFSISYEQLSSEFNEHNKIERSRKIMAFNREPREMFDATCSECGKACQVPFKPVADRPVFCRDCYAKKKGN
jgi:CxxC-x17-CxxC domain-containing protein